MARIALSAWPTPPRRLRPLGFSLRARARAAAVTRAARGAVGAVKPQLADLCREVHSYLHKTGRINFGLAVQLPALSALPPAGEAAALDGQSGAPSAAGEPPAHAAAAAAAAAPQAPPPPEGSNPTAAAADAPPPPDGAAAVAAEEVSDAAVVEALTALLQAADLTTTTEKQIRKALEAQMGVSLSARRALIRTEARKMLSLSCTLRGP